MNPGSSRLPSKQHGSILAVSLFLLLLLTVLGLAASRTTLTKAEDAQRLQARETAFQLAEAALREAERLIDGAQSPAAAITCPPPCAARAAHEPTSAPREWWARNAQHARGSAPGVAAYYFIEEEFELPDSLAVSADGPNSRIVVFRVSAAAGTAQGPLTVVNSLYGRRFN
jgi:type IV pilus assembly protein PilX